VELLSSCKPMKSSHCESVNQEKQEKQCREASGEPNTPSVAVENN